MSYNSLLTAIINNDVDIISQLLYENEIKLVMTNFKLFYLFYRIKSKEMFTILLNYFDRRNVSDISNILTSVINSAISIGVDIKIIKRLVDRGGYINGVDIRGVSPLLQCIKSKRNVCYIKEILKMGADVNEICDDDKNTILHLAVSDFCVGDDLEVIKLLMDYGGEVNARNRFDKIPLMCAVQTANEDLWFEFINRGSDINEQKKSDADSCILLCAFSNKFTSEKLIHKLIVSGANVNAANFGWYHPLLLAIKNNFSTRCIIELIKQGADVNRVCRYNGFTTPLLMAMELKKDKELIFALINNGADVNIKGECGRTPLVYTIKNNFNVEIIDKLINMGADVNKGDSFGVTPLMYAIKKNNKEIIHKLISAGANVNATDKYQRSVLFYAIINDNDKEIINLVLAKGADIGKINYCHNEIWFTIEAMKNEDNNFFAKLIPNKSSYNLKDSLGRTFLMRAIELNMNPNIIFDIIYSGADVNAVDNKGHSPLIYAVYYEFDHNVITKLIKFGADVYFRDFYGDTPLMHAIFTSEFKERIKILIDNGADINSHNKNGMTVLMIVLTLMIDNIKERLDFLIENGADVNVCDNNGLTSLMYAILLNSDSKVEIILELIKGGANVNAIDKDGRSVLHHLFSNGISGVDKIFHILLENGVSISDFVMNLNKDKSSFIGVSNIETLIEILSCKGDIDKHGITLLPYLVNFHKYKGLAHMLICDHVDTLKNDALLINKIISMSADEEFMKRLIQIFGVGINNVDVEGKTPLVHAVINDRDEKFIYAILENGGNSKYLDRNLNTLLHHARSKAVVNILIIFGNTNIIAKNLFGKTSLQCALDRDNVFLTKTIKVLIKHLLLISPEELNNLELGYYSYFFNDYKRELEKMKYRSIIKNLSFHKFCCKLSSIEKDLVSKSKCLYNSVQIKKEFPFYSDIILMKMNRYKIDINKKMLIKKLHKIGISSISTSNYCNENVLLDYDVSYCIFKYYLCRRYVSNFFFASIQ